MSLHKGPRKPSSCATFMLNPHWGRAATGKKSCAQGLFGHDGLCGPVNCGLLGICQRRGAPGKNTGAHWPMLGAIPF